MQFKDQIFLACQHAAPHHLVSRFFGVASDCRTPTVKNWMISRFVRKYDVDMTEALVQDPLAYETFNAFFTRALREGARPLAEEPHGILCPADGAISQLGTIKQGRIFQAKGHSFGLNALLGGDETRAAPFADGEFATVYLSPKDYHRVHMPCAGTLREMVHIPGRLFSVNPLTASHVPDLFARNERVVCIFDTEYGPMALVLVGAMIVASIETVWAGLITPHKSKVNAVRYDASAHVPIHLEKGAEMGRFLLGSTVVAVFGKDRVRWANTAVASAPVRMGELLAQSI